MSWWIRSISDKDTEELVMQRAVCVDIYITEIVGIHRSCCASGQVMQIRAHHDGDTLGSRRRRSMVTCIWDEPPNLATTRALY
jgi:hypothetical protein